MSVQMWIGDVPEYSNERKAIVALARALNELSDLYILLVNFNVHNAGAVDLVVLKRNGIFVVDLKHCEGKVVGEINGDWKIVDQQGDVVKVLNQGRRNPYNQVVQYYYGLSNFLNQNKTQFLSKQKASQADFRRIKSTIVISPELHPDSDINVDWKVDVIGLNEFRQYLFNEISRDIDLTELEMIAIPKLLNCEYWQEFDRLLSPIEMTEIPWRQYLQSLANEDKEWQKFYVPLDITKTVVSKISDLQGQEHEVTEKQTAEITNIVEQYSRVVLLGEPGAGKTTILEHLATDYAESKLKDKIQYIPILVKLNLYDKNRDGLLGLIKETLRAYHLRLDDTHISDMLNSDVRFLFMFDGLNEIPREQMNDSVRELRTFLMNYSEHKYLISCREQDYTHKIEGTMEVNLQGFKHEDILSFFSKFFEHYKGRTKPGLNVFHALTHRILNIATKPLLAYIIAKVAADNSGQIPESCAALFDQFVSDITQREIGKGDVATTGAAIDAELYLSELAFHMHQEMILRIQKDKARRVVRKCWEDLKAEDRCSYSEAEAWQEVWNSRFLLKSGNRITFLHQLFQEFFAAKKLSELLMNEDNKAFDYLTNSWWHEGAVFAIGMMEDPSFVVEYLVGEENSPLLGRCLTGEAGTLVKETTQRCVQKLIDSTEEVEQSLGIKLLGAAGDDPDAVKMLLGLVSTEERSLLKPSESEEALDIEPRQTRVQQKAMRKLWDLIFRTSNPDLINVLDEVSHLSPAARESATQILGRMNIHMNIQNEEKRILQILSDRLQDPHGGVRLVAIQCLEGWEVLSLDTKIIELLREVSHDPNWVVAGSAMEVLIRIGVIESEPDPARIDSQLKGALAALENGDTEFGWYLAISKCDPPPIPQETEEVIRLLGNERYEQLLILSLSREPDRLDGTPSLWGITGLGTYGSDLAIQSLLKYLRPFSVDPVDAWWLRWEAAIALVRIGTVGTMQALINLLFDEQLISRLMASIGLEIARRSKETRRLLLQIGFDSNQLKAVVESCFAEEVGTEAIRCISQLQSQSYEGAEGNDGIKGSEIILDLLKQASSNIVINAALGALDDEQGKICAIWIVGEFGDRKILPQLKTKLSDLDVHTEVNQAIQQIIQRAPEGDV